jgi:long-subunit acyl-CoA synthetase (AMP-forming)
MLPMDVRWTSEERERVAGHFGAQIVLVEPGAAALPSIRTIAVDDAWRRAVALQDPERDFPTSGDDHLLLSLSSGTTGRPKGPVVTHHHFFRRFMTHWINLGLNSHDRYVSTCPRRRSISAAGVPS